MRISEISIRNPVFAWMLMAALILFGAISFNRMGISLLPDVDFPVVTVRLEMEGAAPEIMESDVVDVIEDAIMGVEGIRSVTSDCRQGQASVTVELELGRDVDVALQELNAKIAQAQRYLPQELEPPVLNKTNPEDQPIMWLAVTSEGSVSDLMFFVKNKLRDRFINLPGISEVILGGHADKAMRIWVDPNRLAANEITVDDIVMTINREHIEVPGGLLETASQEIVLRALGEANSAQELANLPIVSRGGAPIFKPIRLKDVAYVEEGLDDIKRISRVKGRSAVTMGFRKQRGTNAVATAQGIIQRIAELKSELPAGYAIQVSFDSTGFIEESVAELEFNLILSAILTGIVCWVFLGSLRSTFNVLLAIPTSIVGAFTVLYFLGFTLNTFTLLGLSLAIGVVVDDAIMMLENIYRHREMGKDRITSARHGAKEIGFAVIATTLAIVAIFLPVIFMQGIIGAYFLQFGITISVAVLLSSLEALTLTPMRASQMMTESSAESTGFISDWLARLADRYRSLLVIILNHPIKIVTGSALVFAISMFILFFIKTEFVPSMDQGRLLLRFKLPVGTSLEKTSSILKNAEAVTDVHPAIKSAVVAIGGFRGGESNSAMMFMMMHSHGERPLHPETGNAWTQDQLAADLRAKLGKVDPELKVIIQDLSQRNFSVSRGFPVEFSVRGSDWQKLGEYSEQIAEKMKASGFTRDVDTTYLEGQPELRIEPNRAAANLRGVSMSAIGNTISSLVGGRKIGQYSKDGRRYDIRLRLQEQYRLTADAIRKLSVRNYTGELVSLSEVVKIEQRPALQSITRENRERSITISANPGQGITQNEALVKSLEIARSVLPAGYSAVISGSSTAADAAFNGLVFSLVLGIVLAYMILGSQFNSFLHPVTVLLAMPFSFTGAFFALWLTGISLNIYSFIGLILLMGLVKKNSILLVEFTNQLRKRGEPAREALLEACPVRLRPIMMTSIATIAAAIPPALALGPGAESARAMAVTILGGMIFSTFLTLIIVPAAYLVFTRFERKASA